MENRSNPDNAPRRAPYSSERVEVVLRAVLCGATVAMALLSRPLWLAEGAFPRVPFWSGWPETEAARLGCVGIWFGSMAAGVFERRALLIGPPALGLLILGDQHRFQPWAYQYAIMALALGGLPRPWSLRACRWFLIGLYIHSGASKLDVSFAREVGPMLLQAGLEPFGLNPSAWPRPLLRAASLSAPLFELVVGVGLIVPRWRRLAAAGAVLTHLVLAALLGPWGLDHSANVVLWNLALVVEVPLLFGWREPGVAFRSERPPRRAWPVLAVVLLAVAMPGLERSGLWDAWPSFALYASHIERVYIEVDAAMADALPPAARRALGPTDPKTGRARLDLTTWSRSERGAPPYPQARATLGVALWLTDHLPTSEAVRVLYWTAADRWTGQRRRIEAVGRAEIEPLAARFRLNAQPAD